MHIIFLGAPGSGKGTHSKWIEEDYKIPHISTGDMFRAAVANKTPAGIKAKEYMDKGLLCPDDVTLEIVAERLKKDDCKNGYLLDGFPRTLVQAQALEELGVKLGVAVDLVLYLSVDNSILVDRIAGRRVCPKCGASFHIKNMKPKVDGICDYCGEKLVQRKDDNPESLKTRLEAYENETAPLIKFYKERGKLVTIDGMTGMDKVKQDIKNVLEK